MFSSLGAPSVVRFGTRSVTQKSRSGYCRPAQWPRMRARGAFALPRIVHCAKPRAIPSLERSRTVLAGDLVKLRRTLPPVSDGTSGHRGQDVFRPRCEVAV